MLQPVKHRLVTPLLALAAGIALAHLVQFQLTDFYWTMPLLSGLTCLAFRRSQRTLPVCICLLLLSFGAFLDVLHRPGKPPEIDAGARETVILDGCVVSPSAFSEGRDQFVIELAPKARARVSLTIRDGETSPDLRYGQLVELEARVRGHDNGERDDALRHQDSGRRASGQAPRQRAGGRRSKPIGPSHPKTASQTQS